MGLNYVFHLQENKIRNIPTKIFVTAEYDRTFFQIGKHNKTWQLKTVARVPSLEVHCKS